MSQKRPQATIHDVAHAAGVSATTVSRVLNNKDYVSSETVEKVRRVIQELNFSASIAAKGMRSRTTHAIGLVVPEVTEPFELAIIRGVGSVIKGSGYDLLIYSADDPPLDKRAFWEREHVTFLSGGLTDGNIVVTPSSTAYPENARIVVIDPLVEDGHVPSVTATNRLGALEAVNYLISLGHRRIGFIGGRPDAESAIRRLEGYRDGLARAGLAYQPELVQSGDFTRKRGREAARQLLQQPNQVTAILAANDASALGVLEVAQELGLSVPKDLSLIGFDNIPETYQTTPRLTTVDQSIQEMGSLATRMLLSILRGEELAAKQCTVPTRLVVRESCQAVSSQP
jgi:LacI family transcriptional regulator